MGLNMDKIRAKYNALKNGGAKGETKNNFWKPQEGEQTIRIVPTPDGDPFRDYWFHYNVGKAMGFLSPKKNFGEEDPLNDFVRSLWSDYNQTQDEETKKLAKDLSAKQRFFAPVLVRGEEDMGVRIWGFSKTVYEDILGMILDPDYGDITDIDRGFDLKVTYGKPAGAQYPKTTIKARRNPTPLSEDRNQVSAWLDSIPDYNTLFPRKTPQEVQVILDEFLMAGSNPEEVSSETTRYSNGATDVDKAFNDLL